MSTALYDSLVEKLHDFLSQHFSVWSPLMSEEEVDGQYDDLVDKFCDEYGYTERTKSFAFHGRWWDTFKDEYYRRLEREGVKIIHTNPTERDWDYGKKFKFEKLGWEAQQK